MTTPMANPNTDLDAKISTGRSSSAPKFSKSALLRSSALVSLALAGVLMSGGALADADYDVTNSDGSTPYTGTSSGGVGGITADNLSNSDGIKIVTSASGPITSGGISATTGTSFDNSSNNGKIIITTGAKVLSATSGGIEATSGGKSVDITIGGTYLNNTTESLAATQANVLSTHTNSRGIDAQTRGGAATVTLGTDEDNRVFVQANAAGILLASNILDSSISHGDFLVTGWGDVTSVSSEAAVDIRIGGALNAGNEHTSTVDFNGAINAVGAGISIWDRTGLGDAIVRGTGNVTSSNSVGISFFLDDNKTGAIVMGEEAQHDTNTEIKGNAIIARDGDVTGGLAAIDGVIDGTGNALITAMADRTIRATGTNTADSAIKVDVRGTGTLTVDGTGTIIGAQNGIRSDGTTGNVFITAQGTITGTAGRAIWIERTSSSAITIGKDAGAPPQGEGAITGAEYGIYAVNAGGTNTIVGTGTTTATGSTTMPTAGGTAIYAEITAGAAQDLIITRSGDITVSATGASVGVRAINATYGASNITVQVGNIGFAGGATGANAENSAGVHVTSGGNSSSGSVIIETGAIAAGFETGIRFDLTSSGNSDGPVSITNTGIVNGETGIWAQTRGSANPVTVTTGADISAQDAGILFNSIESGGAHAIIGHSITATDGSSFGIQYTTAATGGLVNIDHSAGTIQANTGIGIANNIGDIDIDLTGTATVNAVTHAFDLATTSSGTINLDIASTATIGSTDGDVIKAATAQNGTIDITTNTDLTATGGSAAGIRATSEYGDITITADGNVSGKSAGIDASLTQGGGSNGITVMLTGGHTIESDDGVGIKASTVNNNITITADGNVSGKGAGIDASLTGTSSGAVSISQSSGRTIASAAGSAIKASTAVGEIELNLHGTTSTGAIAGHGAELSTTYGNVEVNLFAGSMISGASSAITITGTNNGNSVINNAGTITGKVDVQQLAGNVFTNTGIWNADGKSIFNGDLDNSDGHIDFRPTGAKKASIQVRDFTLNSGSTLSVNVNSESGINLIMTNGAVALAGTLNVKAIGVEGDFPTGDTFVYKLIDNDAGGDSSTTGTFDTINTDFAFLTPTVDIVAKDVFLTLLATDPIPDFKPHADGDNQSGAAGAMDNMDYSSTSGQDLQNAITGLSNDEAADALEQISGSDHQATNGLGGFVTQTFRNLSLNRNGDSGNGPLGYAATTTDVAVAAISEATSDTEISSQFWAHAFGAHAAVKKGTTSADISADSAGVAFGLEFADPSTDWVLGVSAGYTGAKFSTQTAGSSSKSDNFHLGAYGFWGATGALDTGWGVTTAVDYTHHKYETRRALVIGGFSEIAAADYTGGTIGGEFKLRYGMENTGADSNFLWAPILGVNLSQTKNDGYTETGAGVLNITASESTTNHASSLLGVEFAHSNAAADMPIVTTFAIGWRHEFGDTKQSSTYTLQGSPTAFTTASPEEARDRLALQAGVSFATSDTGVLSFSTQGEVSSTSLQYGADVTFKLKF